MAFEIVKKCDKKIVNFESVVGNQLTHAANDIPS